MSFSPCLKPLQLVCVFAFISQTLREKNYKVMDALKNAEKMAETAMNKKEAKPSNHVRNNVCAFLLNMPFLLILWFVVLCMFDQVLLSVGVFVFSCPVCWICVYD